MSIKVADSPKQRFKEDPLRMLRAARFSAQLDFSVESNTEGWAAKNAHKILEVSRERWVIEMDKLLMTPQPSVGLDVLARTRLLNFMFPELSLQVGYDQNSPYHDLTLWEHIRKWLISHHWISTCAGQRYSMILANPLFAWRSRIAPPISSMTWWERIWLIGLACNSSGQTIGGKKSVG